MDNKKVNIGHDFEGNLIQGDGNTIIKNEIDGEGLGQSLGETLSDAAWRERFWEMRHESERKNSRQVMETIFVALVSGFAVAACWELTTPLNVESSFFFVILTTVLFNITGITNFGLRNTIVKTFFLSLAFVLLLQFTPITRNWVNASWVARGIGLSIISAIIGLIVGVFQLLFHPLED